MLADPRGAFRDFYAAVHGNRPYRWQERLFEYVLDNGCWPDVIDAPTGAGKTSVIDVHVVANAVAGGAADADVRRRLQSLPRRLALAVPRRALVDDQVAVSQAIAEKLDTENEAILAEIRRGLHLRAGHDGEPTDPATSPTEGGRPGAPSPLIVASGRGGLRKRRRADDDIDWTLAPTTVALLHFTPDMLGSALLFRRYGAAAGRRPVEAGLLAYDTVAVIDEAHLVRQLTRTARRIAELDSPAADTIGRPVLQVVSTSATAESAHEADRVGIESSDLDTDALLGRRMNASKPVAVVELDRAIDDPRSVADVVQRLLDLHAAHEGPVGCIVNTVRAATRIGAALRKHFEPEFPDRDEIPVLTLVGRMRPYDRTELTERQFKGVLTPEGSPKIQFLVATQTVEVGIDLDLTAMVTQLASASALAQRAGRVNRRGARSAAPITVLDDSAHTKSGVYSSEDLEAARKWLSSFESLSPLAISQRPAPNAAADRTLWQRLEMWDAEFLSSTRESLDAESGPLPAGIELWTRDSFDETVDVSIVVRDLLDDDVLASQLLTLLPPKAEELFPVSIGVARNVLQEYLTAGKTSPTHRRVFIFNADSGEYDATRPSGTDGWSLRLRPGDVIALDSSAPVFAEGVVSDGPDRSPASDVSIAVACEYGSPTLALLASPIPHPEPTFTEDGVPRGPFWVKPLGLEPVARALEERLENVEDSVDVAELCAPLVRQVSGRDPLELFGAMGLGDPEEWNNLIVDVVRGDGGQVGVVLRKPDLRGTSTFTEARSNRAVLLECHQQDVADRARAHAETLGLSRSLAEALDLAGRWHDEGKRDLRFQKLLRRGADPGKTKLLAKSKIPSWGGERRFRASCGLTGWRHEQLSAAIAMEKVPDGETRDLVVRLVGTSHGFGRATFADDARRLIPGSVEALGIDPEDLLAARRLFDEGEWESLIERTHGVYGIWGSAYLEAVLRAADRTISSEGK